MAAQIGHKRRFLTL